MTSFRYCFFFGSTHLFPLLIIPLTFRHFMLSFFLQLSKTWHVVRSQLWGDRTHVRKIIYEVQNVLEVKAPWVDLVCNTVVKLMLFFPFHIEHKASCMLGRGFNTQLDPYPSLCLFNKSGIETGEMPHLLPSLTNHKVKGYNQLLRVVPPHSLCICMSVCVCVSVYICKCETFLEARDYTHLFTDLFSSYKVVFSFGNFVSLLLHLT